MKVLSPVPHRKARIEIIPLIDIMFFLLAAFMLASLSMMRLQSLSMNLPTATAARRDSKPEMINLGVDHLGNISIDKKPYNIVDARHYLTERSKTNSSIPVYITGNENATHEMVIHALDLVKSVGIQNVSLNLNPDRGKQ